MVTDGKGVRLGTQRISLQVSGGTPVLVNKDTGQPVATKIYFGSGQVFVTTTVDLFSDLSLGENSMVPGSRQKSVYECLYKEFMD